MRRRLGGPGWQVPWGPGEAVALLPGGTVTVSVSPGVYHVTPDTAKAFSRGQQMEDPAEGSSCVRLGQLLSGFAGFRGYLSISQRQWWRKSTNTIFQEQTKPSVWSLFWQQTPQGPGIAGGQPTVALRAPFRVQPQNSLGGSRESRGKG